MFINEKRAVVSPNEDHFLLINIVSILLITKQENGFPSLLAKTERNNIIERMIHINEIIGTQMVLDNFWLILENTIR